MCIIVTVPQGEQLPPEENLLECWRCNKAGGGVMFVSKGKVQIQKSLNRDTFIAGVKKLHEEFGKSSPFVIHFRAATVGDTSIENTHPFRANETTAMVHNGGIRQFSGLEYTKMPASDTRLFTLNVLSKLPKDFSTDKNILELLRAYIGAQNKLVFLNTDKEVTYVNKDAGVVDGPYWYSNSMYRLPLPVQPTVKKPTTSVVSLYWDCNNCSAVVANSRAVCHRCHVGKDGKLVKRPAFNSLQNLCFRCGANEYTDWVWDETHTKYTEICWSCVSTDSFGRIVH